MPGELAKLILIGLPVLVTATASHANCDEANADGIVNIRDLTALLEHIVRAVDTGTRDRTWCFISTIPKAVSEPACV